MKICVLGKADVPVSNIARYLLEKGHEVHLVTALEEERPPKGVIRHQLGRALNVHFLLSAHRVQRIIDEIQPDVVHAFYLTSYGYLASRTRNAPVLGTAMGTDLFGAPELSTVLAPVRAFLLRRAIRGADHLHALDPAMSQRLVELGADPAQISTFPRGVSLTRFAPPAERRADVLHLVCNRRLEPVYDHETLLRAAAYLSGHALDYRLEIVGEGSLRRRLQLLAAHLSLERGVCFLGRKPHEAMPAILQRAHIFVSSSLSDGSSSSLLEAMACGCVPVVSDIPANRSWVCDGINGFLFKPGDPRSLADAIVRSLTVRPRWAAIGLANRQRIKADGGLEQGCERVLGIYNEIRMRRTASSVA